MNRTALVGLLVLTAACDVPLVMVEIETPNVCVTRLITVDATVLGKVYGVETPPDAPALPSQLGVDLSGAFETTVDVSDNLVDLPEEAKGLLDLDVQIREIRLRALDDATTPLVDESLKLDGVRVLRIQVVPPADSGLTEKTIIAYDRAAAGTPPGGAIVASGDSLNLAEYLYAGQLRFDYAIDVTVENGPYTFEATACIATHGKAEASVNDFKGF